jgi:Prim-pol 4
LLRGFKVLFVVFHRCVAKLVVLGIFVGYFVGALDCSTVRLCCLSPAHRAVNKDYLANIDLVFKRGRFHLLNSFVMTSFYELARQGVPVYAWLLDRGFYFPKNKDFEASYGTQRRPSHNLYNNGVCYVPPESYGTFLDKYSQSIDQGLFFSENRTPIFRMFFDVDLKVSLPLKEETLNTIVCSLHRSVSEVFREANSKAKEIRMVVAAVGGRKVDDGKKMKYGMHLTFPDLHVTTSLAVEARNIAIAHLIQNESLNAVSQLTDIQWYDVVDHRVYVSAGCRMLFSEKMEYCKICKRDDGTFSTDCTRCMGSGKVRMSKSIYTIQKAFSAPGVQDKQYTADLKSNQLQALRDTSIRTDEHAPNVPNADPKLLQNCSITVKEKYGPIAWHVVGQKASQSDGHPTASNVSEHLADTDERVACIVKLVKQLYPEIASKRAVAKQQFTSPKCITDDAGNPISYIIIDTSKSCLNLERTSGQVKQHNSVNTYFVISPKGVSQRCFCQCQTQSNRIHGPCSTYRSTPRRMYPTDKDEDLFDPSSHTIKILFPHVSKSSGRDTWSDVLSPAPNGTFPVVNQVAFPASNILPPVKNMTKGVKRNIDGDAKPQRPKNVPYEAFDNGAKFVALRRITDLLDLVQRRGPHTAHTERELALHPPKTKKRSNPNDNE